MRNQKYDTNEPIYDTGLPAGSDSEKSASEADLRSIPGREDPLGKETATHSSIPPAWETPRLGEPRRPQSMGSQRVGQD